MRSERPRASGELGRDHLDPQAGHGLTKWRGVLLGYLIAPKGPLAYSEQPGRLLLSQAACLPPPRRLIQISSSESPAASSFGLLDTSSASNETGHLTGYKSGQFICSLHNYSGPLAKQQATRVAWNHA